MEEKLGDVLTIEELAFYLRISKSTLYKLVREGKVPSQKIGRHWRFRKEAIDHWLDEIRSTVSPGTNRVAQNEGTAQSSGTAGDSEPGLGGDR